MDHHLDRQSHHANLPNLPMRFDLECRDIPHVLDTTENHALVYVQSIVLKIVLKLQDHNGAPTALQVLLRYKEVWHRRLAGYLQRLYARHKNRAECLAAVCGSCYSSGIRPYSIVLNILWDDCFHPSKALYAAKNPFPKSYIFHILKYKNSGFCNN